MFADSAKIIIKSGRGGDGHVSFRREKYVPNGGPDGGDGGKGGDIVFEVDDGINTLNDFRHKRKYAAENGEEGKKRNCHGKKGEDLIVKVPAGTIIRDAKTDKVIADMSGANRRQIILTGGKGGLGNQHYATSSMQAPKYAQPGQEAIELEVRAEGDCGRRTGRISECRKIYAVISRNERDAQNCQLSFYYVKSDSRRCRYRRRRRVCYGGHSGVN